MNMLRKYIRFYLPALLTALFAVAALSACSDETDFPSGDIDKAGYITLRVKNSKADSRATVADDDNNENLISSLVLCLYPENNPSGKPAFVKSYTFNTPTQVTIEEKFTTELANTLFPGGATTCHALVVANLPEADAAAISVETSLEDIRKIAISSEFDTKDVQDAFIMDGDAVVTRTGANTANDKATGDIPLTRAAARISLAAKLQNITIGEDDEAEVWEPDPRGLRVILNNGVKNSAVNPANHENVADDYYSTPWSGARTFSRADGAASTDPYTHSVPFYTYPTSWAADGSSDNMTYMTLVCPWRKQGEAQFRNYYYMVPVLKDGNELVRNVAYQVNISLGVLGSLTPDEPMEILDCSYTAVNWGDLNMDVNIQDSRYLVVDQNSYVMDNVTDISIPYYTSHPSEITDIKMTYYRYNVTDEGNEYPVVITKNQIVRTNEGNDYQGNSLFESNKKKILDYSLKEPDNLNPGKYIYIQHPLEIWEPYRTYSTTTGGWWSDPITTYYESHVTQSDLPTYKNDDDSNTKGIQYYRRPANPVAPYSRYEIEVTIQHVGHPEFTQTIKITQYPQMYIMREQNYNGSLGGDPIYGNSYIDGNQDDDIDDDWKRPSGNASGGNNTNPNMYIITTTQLNENTKYIIGDPRTKITFTTSFTSAPDMNGNRNQTLTNYYGADDSKDSYIAPKFRVASSWGKSTTMTKSDAIRRCAAYQELNCPAGRWRLPTRSELEYITSLSDKEYIPLLFNLSSRDLNYTGGWDTQNGYWTAQGRVVQLPSSTGGVLKLSQYQEQASVRCVYDEWYWGDSKVKQNGTVGNTNIPKYPFTWGDE